MKIRTFCLLLGLTMALATQGCVSRRDITSRAGSRTDYVGGQVYELQKPVFLFKLSQDSLISLAKLGHGGTPKDLSAFRLIAGSHSQVRGLLLPGSQILVTRFIEDRSWELGNLMDVFAVITTGEYKGTEVEVSMISTNGRPGYSVFVDSEYLIPLR